MLLVVAVFGGNILAQAQTLTTIHSFTGKDGDGEQPYPQHLAFDSTGAVYGTTVTNGSPYWGPVFQLVPPTIDSRPCLSVVGCFVGHKGGVSYPVNMTAIVFAEE